MQEPSVLDYLKSLLMPWKGERIRLEDTPPVAAESPLPPLPGDDTAADWAPPQTEPLMTEREEPAIVLQRPIPIAARYRIPWLSLLALALALLAQTSLEPPNRSAMIGIVFYGLAAAALLAALLRGEWRYQEHDEDAVVTMPRRVNRLIVLLGGGFSVLAFFMFSHNHFSVTNLMLGLLALGYMIAGVFDLPSGFQWMDFWRGLGQRIAVRLHARPAVSWGAILLGGLVIGVAVFFRFYRLNSMPGEMFSDQAEKLLDVADVLQGQTSIFFPRNTGREAFQFYLTAAINVLLGTGLSFISLKIGTVLAGLLTLPYLYLLGKEVNGKWTGLFAAGLAAVAYWPNVISRIGLRFPLYALFAAPALYYLVRGLRRQNRNDFIWAGIAVGIGLHGYTPFRIVPFVLIVLMAIYLLHRQSSGKRRAAIGAFVISGVIALVIFLPLARYALEEPMNMQYFGTRAFSRLGTTEREYPAAPLQIFIENLGKSWLMPFWDDGETWVTSITGRPALDVVSAALYFLGSCLVLARYIRRRHWLDLSLLLLVPLLMLPSILSLAFPNENPSLNRSGGAIIPVFILAGIGLEGILRAVRGPRGSRLGLVLAVLLGAGLWTQAALQNFDLTFRQFDRQYMAGVWNTSQIGAVVREFVDTIGAPDSAFVIPYPYWVDTRLVGINAGNPLKDYALPRDQLGKTIEISGPKLFIYKPEDVQTGQVLGNLYPMGSAQLIQGAYPGKEFFVFIAMPVPGVSR